MLRRDAGFVDVSSTRSTFGVAVVFAGTIWEKIALRLAAPSRCPPSKQRAHPRSRQFPRGPSARDACVPAGKVDSRCLRRSRPPFQSAFRPRRRSACAFVWLLTCSGQRFPGRRETKEISGIVVASCRPSGRASLTAADVCPSRTGAGRPGRLAVRVPLPQGVQRLELLDRHLLLDLLRAKCDRRTGGRGTATMTFSRVRSFLPPRMATEIVAAFSCSSAASQSRSMGPCVGRCTSDRGLRRCRWFCGVANGSKSRRKKTCAACAPSLIA